MLQNRLKRSARYSRAVRTLMAEVAAAQRPIRGVRPPERKRVQSYRQVLSETGRQRGRGLWYPYVGGGLGRGSYVELADGSVKLDWITGIGVHFFGHMHPGIVRTAVEASCSDLVMQGNLQANLEPGRFSEVLLGYVKPVSRLRHVFLCGSGAMANENALKILRQFRCPAHKIIAFRHCFAGRTGLMSSLTDNPNYRQGLPVYPDFDYIPFYDASDPASTAKSVQSLRKTIANNKGRTAALMLEPVQGEGGFQCAPKSFFKALIAVCRQHGIPVWADEVQTFGRTTELLASRALGFLRDVDVLTFGKLSHVCGVLFTRELNPGPGLLSQTFVGSTTALAVGRYMIRRLVSGRYYGPQGRIRKLETRFRSYFENLQRAHPAWISDYTVVGAMVALTPFDGSSDRVKQLANRLFENGLICFVCGHGPYRLRFLLPGAVVTEAEITEGLKILEKTMAELEEGQC